ncbi:MAG: molybdopterin-dependent oxidoreductase [Chloroflexi bacterium]|nr:molybdopterin-dependent oxidoreductase [Chloroflexota bacterium]
MNEKKLVNVFCGAHCSDRTCEFQAEVEAGKIVRFQAHPKMKYPPCAMGWTSAFYYHPEALQYPLKREGGRGEDKWQRISWDEALDTIVRELNAVKARHGNEALAWYSGWTAMTEWELPSSPRLVLEKLFTLWGGCVKVAGGHSSLAGAASKAKTHLYGDSGRNVAQPEPNECKLIIIWGLNPAETWHKARMSYYLDARERGARFIVFDPVFTPTAAALADEYIPVRPGTDGALALSMINVMIRERLYDSEFVASHTNAPFLVRSDNGLMLRENHIAPGGAQEYLVWDRNSNRPQDHRKPALDPALSGKYAWQDLELEPVWQKISDLAGEWPPERASALTGVPAATIVRLARELAAAKPARIDGPRGGSLGFHTWAENTVTAIEFLNVITGNIRGNLDLPANSDIGLMVTARKILQGSKVATPFPANHLAEAILDPSKYNTNIRALFCMYANPVGQLGNSNRTISALQRLDFVAVADMFMTATARYADIVLPSCLAWARSQVFEGSDIGNVKRYAEFRRIDGASTCQKQLYFSEKAVEPLGESKDDFDIVCALARKLGYGRQFPWQNVEEYITEVLEKARQDPAFPWLKSISMERLRSEGIVDVDEFPSVGPVMEFPTPSGKIELYSETLLKQGLDAIPVYRHPEEGAVKTPELHRRYPLNLIVSHSQWRAGNNFYNQPELLENYINDVLLSPSDAARRGIADGDTVTVFNERGAIEIKATVAEAILPGVVHVYHCGSPDQGMENLLTGNRLTGYARSPTFNTCLVEVKRKLSS